MASITNPNKKYLIDNCPVVTINSSSSDHPEEFDEYPNLFAIELFNDTATAAEAESENNPVPMYHTGNIKNN
jgi:hypothetical protein